MPVDHSLTYRQWRLKNVPHILRKQAIEREVRRLHLCDIESYADVGCSNGYLTHAVAQIVRPLRTVGLDHQRENLRNAERAYGEFDYSFEWIDLNVPMDKSRSHDFVTCFETLEHVGNLAAALDSVLEMRRENGVALITVPIEVGKIGWLKAFLKLRVYGRVYIKELDQLVPGITPDVLLNRIANDDDVKSMRPEGQNGFGTHFGFDYRELATMLNDRNASYDLFCRGTSAFFVVRG